MLRSSSSKEKCLKNTMGSECIAFRQCEYFKGPSLVVDRLYCGNIREGSSLSYTCRVTRLKLGNKNMIHGDRYSGAELLNSLQLSLL